LRVNRRVRAKVVRRVIVINRDAVVSAGILYDKERLERGQSTDIVSYQDLNRTYAQVRAERAKLERELGITELELSTAPEMGDDTGNQLI